MAEIIDLDVLLPSPVKVKLSGKVVDLLPGKLKTLVRIQDLATNMMEGERGLEKINEIIDLLSEIIPAIKTDKDIDISPLQLNKIIEVAYKALTPDSQELKSAEMQVSVKDKKKGEDN